MTDPTPWEAESARRQQHAHPGTADNTTTPDVVLLAFPHVLPGYLLLCAGAKGCGSAVVNNTYAENAHRDWHRQASGPVSWREL
jgi:hypothetical protein